MRLHSLEHIDLEILAQTFNKAFEGYFVPIKMDAQLLADKIKSENIVPEHSVGISVNDELAGFILIGIDTENKLAYNAGTGIIPEFRGQKFTEKMYAYLLPKLTAIGIREHRLEVICQNEKALKIYQNLGYSVSRKLICYKGKISEPNRQSLEIEEIGLPNETEIKSFWNHKPAYQNSTFCIKNAPEKHKAFGKFQNGKLIGYIVFAKDALRVKQFGIDKDFRNGGIGYQLFYKVQDEIPEREISIINVDENDLETNSFLRKIGLIPFVGQFEMKLDI